MTKPALFLDIEHKLSFEKIAMPVKLSDAPEAWQREVASEIFKQLPYLGDYSVNVILDRVDGERGFAFGSAMVTNKSEAPKPQQDQLPTVRIPIIVRDRLLLPMDVFMDGTGVYPLSPGRLREHLFRTDAFEMSTRKPTDQGMVDSLYPPMRQFSGLGAVAGDQMGMGKLAASGNPAEKARRQAVAMSHSEAAAHPNGFVGKYAQQRPLLLEMIAPTIATTEADAFVDKIASDMGLRIAAAKNQTFEKLAMVVAKADRQSLEKTASALVSAIKPTVVQFEKRASGDWLVKWANAGAFAPQQDVVSPEAAAEMSGGQTAAPEAPAVITVGTEKAQKSALKEEAYEQVNEPGVYKVQNLDTNEELVGHILPIEDFDMHPLELFVFVTNGAYAVQDEIAGVRQSEPQPDLPIVPIQQAQGDGVLVYDISGKMHALLPMTIQNLGQDPAGGLQVMGETMFGEPVTLSMAPGLQAIQEIGDQEYAVPDFVQWLPLQQLVMLAKQPLDVEAVHQGQQAPSTVDVGSTGQGEFSMDGPPVEKLATGSRHFIKRAQAEFLLVAMGQSPIAASALLKQAERAGKVKVAGLKQIIPLSDVHAQMVKKAAKTLSNFPYHLKRDLVKEAAVLEDGETADKILSMGFLNPDNISMFASYLPELDTASCKLAEMLVACRLGMSQVDEGAIERAMKNLESVIEGLKSLQEQELL